jgi:hypothetical protein
LAGALLFDEKSCQRVTLVWFGLRNDEILYLQAATQRTIDASPAFMEYGSVKKIAVWAHANRDPNKQEDWVQFCMELLRTLKSFKIFKSEIKKFKTCSGWCPFKGLSNDTTLMQIQSGWTVPLKPTFGDVNARHKIIEAVVRASSWDFDALINVFCRS